MKSVVIQIGNSDDKLTQMQWAAFVARLRDCVERHDARIHFWGASANYEPWQNLCCVCESNGAMYPMLSEISEIRKEFKQDSVAVTIGGTEFI